MFFNKANRQSLLIAKQIAQSSKDPVENEIKKILQKNREARFISKIFNDVFCNGVHPSSINEYITQREILDERCGISYASETIQHVNYLKQLDSYLFGDFFMQYDPIPNPKQDPKIETENKKNHKKANSIVSKYLEFVDTDNDRRIKEAESFINILEDYIRPKHFYYLRCLFLNRHEIIPAYQLIALIRKNDNIISSEILTAMHGMLNKVKNPKGTFAERLNAMLLLHRDLEKNEQEELFLDCLQHDSASRPDFSTKLIAA